MLIQRLQAIKAQQAPAIGTPVQDDDDDQDPWAGYQEIVNLSGSKSTAPAGVVDSASLPSAPTEAPKPSISPRFAEVQAHLAARKAGYDQEYLREAGRPRPQQMWFPHLMGSGFGMQPQPGMPGVPGFGMGQADYYGQTGYLGQNINPMVGQLPYGVRPNIGPYPSNMTGLPVNRMNPQGLQVDAWGNPVLPEGAQMDSYGRITYPNG
jgi:hypothetical protein